MHLAKTLLRSARALETPKEKKERLLLAEMTKDEKGRAFITALADRLFRSKSSARSAKTVRELIKQYGTPSFLPLHAKVALSLVNVVGAPLIFLLKGALRGALSRVILLSQGKRLFQEIQKRVDRGVKVNLNHLGEAILGEGEAKRRLQDYLEDLKHPEVTCISVKISTLYSQINLLTPRNTIDVLKKRLSALYRAAGEKIVNLDMEEFRDLELTVDLFIETLSLPEFNETVGGIALQAYLPESFDALQRLIQFAKRRKAPLKVRLVKGANLLMEQMEARLKGWPQAPFALKSDSDAHFLKMLDLALCKENGPYLQVGVGSHNLFDIAYAIERAKKEEVAVQCEMLEGMAGALEKAVAKKTGDLLLYTPAVSKRAFPSAVAYLLRRVDENSAKENFLSRFFSMEPEDATWNLEERKFQIAMEWKESISSKTRRGQNRLLPPVPLKRESPFSNEPDTDWTRRENLLWIEEALKERPLSVSTLPWKEVDLAIDRAEGGATSDQILAAANLMRERRGLFISYMVHETKKIASEADVEVSEAIDFLTYYRSLILNGPSYKPIGLTLVSPPWNFPLSIATSGITSALLVGAPVLFKPAPEARAVGKLLAEIFWEAGISKSALQFIPCEDDPVGSRLVQDKRIKKILLTGSTETARHFLRLRPEMNLSAETGGKNALIVTASSDRDLAIRDTIQSAFSHAGQKCSALSLLILERELYEDEQFLEALKDAAASLKVGPAEDLETKVPPLIKPPEGVLKRALTTLEEGESWLLQPKIEGELVTPGIKMGVKPGSFSHLTEFFGPHLSILSADSLEEAVALANQVPYGLTAGIHTLDEEEIATFTKKMRAGNLYINRTLTGAIVQRQPFGGTKDSSFGLGFKIGGPNSLRLVGMPQYEGEPLSYAAAMRLYFSGKEDPSGILGQENSLYYVPHEKMLLLLQGDEDPEEVASAFEAAAVAGAPLTPSYEPYEGFRRVRALRPPSEEQLKQLAEWGATLIADPVTKEGRIELLYYLREVAISYDTHRYGLISFHPNI